MAGQIIIRECTTLDEFDSCVSLQRKVFALPDLEISPRRHLVVSKRAGGWILGAFVDDELIGFVHHLVGTRDHKIIGYSHMMAVAAEYQGKGVGALLKWAQRERAIKEGVDFITWTWDPMMARNAYFNLNKLGVEVRSYAVNFYGTDYGPQLNEETNRRPGIDSDRLFAEWNLLSPRVEKLSLGQEDLIPDVNPTKIIKTPPDWQNLVKHDPARARQEQLRVRKEFQEAFSNNLVCREFKRSSTEPQYLLFN
jgi:predicted GNAT superfamily acetyltransferase